MMKSISQPPIDPMQVLPDEMLNECLSLLPPSSIAHSSAINKTWSQFIYSHPNLHSEADLSHLGFAYYRDWCEKHKGSAEDEDDLENLLNTFHHISITPTVNHLTKLSINLSILWQRCICLHYHSYDIAEIMKDFASSMSASEFFLKEINFYLDRDLDGHNDEDSLEFVLLLIREIDLFNPQYFHSLKSVWIQAPVYFSIKAGGGQTSRSFVLVPTMPMCKGTWEEPENFMIEMIELANEFAGEEGGLTDFRINYFEQSDFRHNSMDDIVRVLKKFTETLENLHFDPIEMANLPEQWDLASSCSELVSFFSEYEYGLELPERPNSNLKDFGVYCDLPLVDWSMLKGWVGDSLEKLNLLAESGDADIRFALHSPMSIIFDSRVTLKVLELKTAPYKAPIQELQAHASFPNLESLSLDVGLEMMEWLCKLDLPRLQTLCFQTFNFDNYEGKKGKTATNHILSLLEKHSSKLFKLAFKTSQYNDPEFFSDKVPQLSFVKLVHLDLSRCSKSHKSWFSTFLYPNLVSFSKYKDNPFLPQAFQDETMESQVEWKQKEQSNLWERLARESI